jgi:hypothetical protein
MLFKNIRHISQNKAPVPVTRNTRLRARHRFVTSKSPDGHARKSAVDTTGV